MTRATEVVQLAHILRISADVARDLASLRPLDAERLDRLATQADAMAVELASIAEPCRSAKLQ